MAIREGVRARKSETYILMIVQVPPGIYLHPNNINRSPYDDE